MTVAHCEVAKQRTYVARSQHAARLAGPACRTRRKGLARSAPRSEPGSVDWLVVGNRVRGSSRRLPCSPAERSAGPRWWSRGAGAACRSMPTRFGQPAASPELGGSRVAGSARKRAFTFAAGNGERRTGRSRSRARPSSRRGRSTASGSAHGLRTTLAARLDELPISEAGHREKSREVHQGHVSLIAGAGFAVWLPERSGGSQISGRSCRSCGSRSVEDAAETVWGRESRRRSRRNNLHPSRGASFAPRSSVAVSVGHTPLEGERSERDRR